MPFCCGSAKVKKTLMTVADAFGQPDSGLEVCFLFLGIHSGADIWLALKGGGKGNVLKGQSGD